MSQCPKRHLVPNMMTIGMSHESRDAKGISKIITEPTVNAVSI